MGDLVASAAVEVFLSCEFNNMRTLSDLVKDQGRRNLCMHLGGEIGIFSGTCMNCQN